MRPRCDSVRLDEDTSFFFLLLVSETKAKEQLVVKNGDNYRRLGIALDSASWVRRDFGPTGANGAVVATKDDAQERFGHDPIQWTVSLS